MPLCLQPNPATTHEDALPVLRERDFLRIAHLAHQLFGLDLRNDNQDFVAARLGRMVRELGFESFEQYCDYLLADRSGTAAATLVDRLTTNHTAFFREPAHFDFLRETVLPALDARSNINIWSAGCSSGEEPYSIAIAILEAAPRLATKTRIHATDISTRMLRRAAAAVYSADRIAAIPAFLRNCHFVHAGEPTAFRAAPQVRSLVDFTRFNLMDPFPATRYSAIFCRNVMLYFDRATHRSLVERFTAQLEPGGFLFIGHSESLAGIDHSLEPAGPAIYRKPAQRRAHSFAAAPPASRASLTQFSVAPEEVSA
jgi:chemotaxis protein methyltransferase CheR